MEFQIAKESANYNRRRPQHVPNPELADSKTPPQAVELEEAVLGACMLDSRAFAEVSEMLRPESFYNPANQKIWTAIQELGFEQHPIDMLTVTDRLRQKNELDEVGGPVKISSLTSLVTSAANIQYHARIVYQKHLARELISFSSQVGTLAFDESLDVQKVLEEAQGQLYEISRTNIKRDVIQIDSVVTAAIDKITTARNSQDSFTGLQTGYRDLDKCTNGWQPSDLIIIAARPAMGKTAFVLSMAKNMAVDYNTPVAIFSLEMSNLQLVNRLISNTCNIEGQKIKSGQLTDLEMTQLNQSIQKLYGAPLYIDDTPSLSVFELRTKAIRLKNEHNIGIIIIDYLQLMNATGMRFGSREQEVSTISRSLKGLAKELDIPIIALSQLNRSVESRGGDDKNGKRPQLSDLRESGAIEQDADIVCFIHRPEYYLRGTTLDAAGNDLRGVAEFIIAKHRSGSTEDVKMRFVAKYARFENADEGDLTTQVGIVGSRMNNDNATGAAPASDAPAPDFGDFGAPPPPSGNTDFLKPDPGETPAPF